MLTINIRDKVEIFAAYMPFIKNGGIFIPTEQHYALGDAVEVQVQISDTPEPYNFMGKIIWVTPKRAQGGRIAGVGIQFSGDAKTKELRSKIEAQLAGSDPSNRYNDTM